MAYYSVCSNNIDAEKALENLFDSTDGLFGVGDPSHVIIDINDTSECNSSSSSYDAHDKKELDEIERIIKEARISLEMGSPISDDSNTNDRREREENVSNSSVLDVGETPRKKRRIQLNDSILSDISANSIGE